MRPFRNASVLCSTRSPRGPAERRVDFNQTLQKCKLFMFHGGPQKSFRNKGALCCTSIFGSKNLKMHAGISRPFRNAKPKNPSNANITPPRRPKECNHQCCGNLCGCAPQLLVATLGPHWGSIGPHWCHIGATLGPHWGHIGAMRHQKSPLQGKWGNIGATLGQH